MPPKRRIYLLDPQRLPPETIAVTFAKTSRSPQSFDEIAAELTDETSAEFHEKWVVGYGHASVAEHAVLHLAVEGVSRLAVEVLESNRLASYTEKSTRYQKWTGEEFYRPEEFADTPLMAVFEDTCRLLFATYEEALESVRKVIEVQMPRREGEGDGAWERRIRSAYVDVCRFLLPAASAANVGMTINARALEHAITKLLSDPLSECQAIGEELRQAAVKSVPTLVKYASFNPYMVRVQRDVSQIAVETSTHTPGDWCALTGCSDNLEQHLLSAGLYRFGGMSSQAALETVKHLNAAEMRHLAEVMFDKRGEHDQLPREVEHGEFTFDVLMDQGAFYEVKRHRMMTLSAQRLTTRLGYAVPRLMVAAGMEKAYRHAMQAAHKAFLQMEEWNPEAAAYVVPNGFNRRVLLTMNLRSADHFIALRSAPNAHFSVRRVAQRMAEMLRGQLPVLGDYLRPAEGETWQQIEADYFTQTA